VALAVPNAKYRIANCDFQRISECRVWPPQDPRPERSTGMFTELVRRVSRMWNIAVQPPRVHVRKQDRPPMTAEEVRNEARSRHNVMVSAQLQDRSSGVSFSVSTYHMPCVFWSQPVMLIHAALAAQHAKVCGVLSPVHSVWVTTS
jgi:hypothetical protein